MWHHNKNAQRNINFRFKTFAMLWMSYTYFWVIPRHLNFMCRRFRTPRLFHLHRRVGVEWLGWEMLGYLYKRMFGSSHTFSRINTPTFLKLVILHTYPPMKMEQTGCSETSGNKIQTPGNYPEESIQYIFYWVIGIQKLKAYKPNTDFSATHATRHTHQALGAAPFPRLWCWH